MNEALKTTQEPSDLTMLMNHTTAQEEEEIEIDLIELFYLLWGRLHYIILFALIGALLLNAYSYFLIHPTYESTSSLYIVSASGGGVVDLSDLNIGTTLKSDYQELILSYPVLDRVSEDLDLDWSTEQMQGAIRVENPRDTRILKLIATAQNPKLAMDIANTLAEVAVDYLPVTMSTDAPNIAQKARLPQRKANPSYTKYTLIGGFFGAMCCAGWIVLRYLMDDTIRTAEDMEKHFGLTPLTSIPFVDEFSPSEHKKSRRKRKHGLFGRKEVKR